MASDYGDESGEKMLDNFTRFGERMGEEAMRNRADRLHEAFEHAKSCASEKGAPWNEPSEWAKLDMREFREIEGYDGVKQIIESKMRARGVDTAWFEDKENKKEYLLFRIADAQDVWRGFDELAKETEGAKERAAENLKRDVARKRDERPLDERAEQARQASEQLQRDGGSRARERAPRPRRDRQR